MTEAAENVSQDNLLDLNGRTALVTGGGKGIGQAIATALAHQGATVVVVARDVAALRSTTESLGSRHSWIAGDLTNDSTYAELSEAGLEIDVLVNNAGGNPHAKPWLQQTAAELLETYEVNLVAASRLTKIFSPGMVERGHGRIINIASIYGSLGQSPEARPSNRGGVAYVAAKHATVGLTIQLAIELAPCVTVNAVSPGMIAWRSPVTDEQIDVMKRNRSRTPRTNGHP